MAAGLRDGGFDGEVVLIGSEPELPYERPHLSKGFLLGSVSRQRLGLRPSSQYRELDVELLLGERVEELDLGGRTVVFASGRRLAWDRLCIATGSAARTLPGFEDALYLRELPDAERLRQILDSRQDLTLIGAGFIGCEVAAAAGRHGCRVSVFEALSQPMQRVLGAELGGYLAGVHRDHGVDLHLDAQELPALEPPVVVGVGSRPRTELAEASGLEIDAGIMVDELGRTSAPDVFAAGDVTRFWSLVYSARIQVEHFQTAQRQGFATGRAMAGVDAPYREVPWFWTDQYDLNLQYAGAGLEWDSTIARGVFGRPPFSVFYLKQGRLIAVAGVNDRHTVARARRVMEVGVKVSPAQLEDPAFDLRRALP